MTSLTIIPTEFLHLSRGYKNATYPACCGVCGVSEIDDILDSVGMKKPCPDLTPMYTDHRNGGRVCQECAERGTYLEIQS